MHLGFLKPGGRLVIPLGRLYMGQDLMLVKKDENGKVSMQSVLGVAFVPFVREKPGKT